MKQLSLTISSSLNSPCSPKPPIGAKLSADSVKNLNYKFQSQVLNTIWQSLIADYFPDRTDLLEYSIGWSIRRQKRTLASCNLRAKKILVAQELDHSDYHRYLSPLIYHELCHAVLGYSVHSATSKSRWHGREFRCLEQKHPEIPLLNQWIKIGGWGQAIRRHRGKFPIKRQTKSKTTLRSSFLYSLLKKFNLLSRQSVRTKKLIRIK